MHTKQIILGTLAYTLVTFTLAVGWHIEAFGAMYQEFGYLKGEPSYLLGFVTILIQGFTISALYPLLRFSGTPIIKGLKVSLTMGIFLWTSHVLGFVAKQNIEYARLFMFMESGYLLVQFVVFGLLIGLIYRKDQGR